MRYSGILWKLALTIAQTHARFASSTDVSALATLVNPPRIYIEQTRQR